MAGTTSKKRDRAPAGAKRPTGYALGMVGLGVMGRNLVLNMGDHGFSVTGYDRDTDKVDTLRKDAGDRPIGGAASPGELVAMLERPRALMMLVPAGRPVDAVIREFSSRLDAGDLIVDGGNSYFGDTDLRGKALAEKGLLYMGMGISGGEEGARHGPSMMPGGPKKAYERLRPMFEAVAAHVDGEPCVAWLGPGAAGHYVKMVHNGIEYAIMQLIAETYDVMKRGYGATDDELHATYAEWAKGPAAGYLLEITANIFEQADPYTGKRLVDVVLDAAKQLGTGEWASQSALELGVPTPNIDIAVAARNLSAMTEQRHMAGRRLPVRQEGDAGERGAMVRDLADALYAGMIVCYAQGMDQLASASDHYRYELDRQTVASIWRGGCIIQAALLEDVRGAYERRPSLPGLLLDDEIGQRVVERQGALRRVVRGAAGLGLPVPGMSSALAYFDSYRSDWLPANLIQAQRDYFGAHTYERIDEKGVFHTEWPEVE